MSLETFRTVSLTSCVAKGMEGLAHYCLQWRLERTDVWHHELTGFPLRRCTMNGVLNIVSYVEHKRRNGDIVVVVFQDVTRVLDTASHVIILEVLLKRGI